MTRGELRARRVDGTIGCMTQSKADYYNSLPAKRMGAGCLFFNARRHILLVKPTYKPGWEVPGGIVELNESPRRCCAREVLEELGLLRDIGRILIVEYNDPNPPKTESLMFIFDGGVLSEDEIGRIQLQASELSTFQFFPPDSLPDEMSATLKRRVEAAWQQAVQPTDAYADNLLAQSA